MIGISHAGTTRANIMKVLRSSAAATAVNGLVGILILPMVLDNVTVTRYGEWVTLAALLAIGGLAEAGVGTEISRRVAGAWGNGDREEAQQAVRQGTTVLAGIALILVLIGGALARPIVDGLFPSISIWQRGQLVLLLYGALLLLGATFVGNGFFSVLNGLQRSDYALWSGIAGTVLGAGVTVGGLALGLGLWALLAAGAVQLVIGWIGPAIGVMRLLPELRFHPVRVPLAIIVSFIGMPAMVVVAGASTIFDSQLDKLVLSYTIGPKASAMFQIGVNLVQGSRGLAIIPLGVLLAGTAELYRTRPDKLRRLEDLAGSTAQSIAAITAGGMILFAPAFLRLWLGTGYGPAAFSVQMLAGASLLNIWSAPWFFYAVGRGRYGYVAASAVVTSAVNLIATIVLTSRIGLLGALIGSLAGQVAGGVAGWLIVRQWEKRRWLCPALRATGAVGIIVVPFLVTGSFKNLSWEGLFEWGFLYMLASGVMIILTRSSPLQLSWRRPGIPSIKVRELPRDTTANHSSPCSKHPKRRYKGGLRIRRERSYK